MSRRPVVMLSPDRAESDRSLGVAALARQGPNPQAPGLEQHRTAAAELRLERIVSDHFDALWRFLRQLGIPECDVDDGVQDVLVVVARRLTDIEQGCERAFVFSTAVRVALGLRRSRYRRREQSDGGLVDLPDPQPGPETTLDLNRARRQLDAVLDELPTELRAVFVLYEIEELTMAEIATLLDLRAGTVASRLRRARGRFEKKVRALEAELARRSRP